MWKLMMFLKRKLNIAIKKVMATCLLILHSFIHYCYFILKGIAQTIHKYILMTILI